jgi:hypothetical protein
MKTLAATLLAAIFLTASLAHAADEKQGREREDAQG